MNQYRQHFNSSELHPNPRCSIGAFVICADSDDEAEKLALSRDQFLVSLRKGNPQPIMSPEEVRQTSFSLAEQAVIADARKRTFAGSPETVKHQLDELVEIYGAEEAVVVTITHDFDARLRSYELLARAYDLQPKA